VEQSSRPECNTTARPMIESNVVPPNCISPTSMSNDAEIVPVA
jgi:hypothetical protein